MIKIGQWSSLSSGNTCHSWNSIFVDVGIFFQMCKLCVGGDHIFVFHLFVPSALHSTCHKVHTQAVLVEWERVGEFVSFYASFATYWQIDLGKFFKLSYNFHIYDVRIVIVLHIYLSHGIQLCKMHRAMSNTWYVPNNVSDYFYFLSFLGLMMWLQAAYPCWCSSISFCFPCCLKCYPFIFSVIYWRSSFSELQSCLLLS